jgi:hypothetical protein
VKMPSIRPGTGQWRVSIPRRGLRERAGRGLENASVPCSVASHCDGKGHRNLQQEDFRDSVKRARFKCISKAKSETITSTAAKRSLSLVTLVIRWLLKVQNLPSPFAAANAVISPNSSTGFTADMEGDGK